MKFVKFFCLMGFFCASVVLGQKTFLDTPTNIGLYRAFKEIAFRVIGKTGDNVNNNRWDARHDKRVQRRISKDVQFPCNVTAGRSKSVPNSVHKLRPGDIDIIGAMGDSLTAGSGIFALNVLHVAIENRGVAALGGGQATWRDYLTIPNIIKEFNPNLIGYASYDSLTHQKASAFNVAEIAAMSRDLPFMAENLIRRIKNYPGIDYEKSWKLVSILIGPNDICSDMCWTTRGPWSILKNHKNDLIQTLRIFKRNLPRTFISLIPVPNLTILADLPRKPFACQLATDVECSCLMGTRFKNQRNTFNKIIRAWQKIDYEVSNYEEFQTEEFTVVVQPFTANLTYPLKPDGTADWRYLSTDCFHLSQMGNARATMALWKNMLEPVGQKSEDWSDDSTILCPTESEPFLKTSLNSRSRSNF